MNLISVEMTLDEWLYILVLVKEEARNQGNNSYFVDMFDTIKNQLTITKKEP